MPRHRSSVATSERLSQFRGNRRPLPPGDKRVVIALLVHLCFLPWALGTMHPWSQITSLVLSAIGFVIALTARGERAEGGGLKPEGLSPSDAEKFRSQVSSLIPPSAWSRLRRFAPFWLGLALLAYIFVQALNPSWRYVTNGTSWWLVKVPDISWLPTSVDAPFARFNAWRQFIIYASAWLTLCTVAIGITRRRTFGVLLTGLALNGLVLVLVGFALRLVRPSYKLLWFDEIRAGVITFASFIYKNHAGAYLALIAAVLLMLAARYRERALRDHATSSPALLPVLGALVVFFAVVFTYSRAGTVLLGVYLVAAAAVFAVHRTLTGTTSSTPRVVTFTVAGMVASVVIFALAQLDFRKTLERFEKLADPARQDVSVSQRIEANEAGRDMLSHMWPRGSGAGSFRHLFPEYIRRFDGSFKGGKLFWQHAHNDWLQIPIEQGVVGSGLILAGGLWWLWRLGRVRVWRSLPAMLLALGLFQTLGHATIDFPFQNPAILITWLVLAAIAAKYSATDGEVGGRK